MLPNDLLNSLAVKNILCVCLCECCIYTHMSVPPPLSVSVVQCWLWVWGTGDQCFPWLCSDLRGLRGHRAQAFPQPLIVEFPAQGHPPFKCLFTIHFPTRNFKCQGFQLTLSSCEAPTAPCLWKAVQNGFCMALKHIINRWEDLQDYEASFKVFSSSHFPF